MGNKEDIFACVIGGLAFIAMITGLFTFATWLNLADYHVSRSTCEFMKTPENCQDLCGCGWCSYENNTKYNLLSDCQPINSFHCIGGEFNDASSDRCNELFDSKKEFAMTLTKLFLATILAIIATSVCACGKVTKEVIVFTMLVVIMIAIVLA